MNTKRTIRIGTRGSRLALVQTEIISKMLLRQQPDLNIEQVIIKTQGDKILDVSLRATRVCLSKKSRRRCCETKLTLLCTA